MRANQTGSPLDHGRRVTVDTDYLLVKEADFPAAVAALRGAGHSIEGVLP